jgi:hypothetical protein
MSLSLMSLSPMSLSPMSLSPMSLSLRHAQIARLARTEPVLALQRRQWLLHTSYGQVFVMFVSFILIFLSQSSIVTRVARFLDRLRSILFIGFVFVLFYWFYFVHSIMGYRACSVFATPGVIVLRLNKSLKYRELIPTTDCSGPAPTFDPFYGEYSTPRVSSTMLEKTHFHCLEFSFPKEVHLRQLAT